MLDQELPVFRVKRIVQMIPDIVCVQLLLCGIDLSVAVDDHVSGSLLPENLRIDIRDMLRLDNRYVMFFQISKVTGNRSCDRTKRNPEKQARNPGRNLMINRERDRSVTNVQKENTLFCDTARNSCYNR